MFDYQVTFGAGEVDPGLWGRFDMAFQDKGLSFAENVLVRKTGGIVKRGGLEYVAAAYHHDKVGRLIPYDFGLGQTYVVELQEGVARFVRDGALVGAPTTVAIPYLEDELYDIGYAAAGDTITLCHWTYTVRNLVRASDTSWSLSAATFSPSQAAPTGASASYASGGTATRSSWYKVTAVSDATGEESLPTTAFQESTTSGTGTLTLSWTSASGAGRYRIYKDPTGQGIFGFIGQTETTGFVDSGYDPDETDTPPEDRNPFNGAGSYPEAVTYFQQRRWFASTENDPTLLESSRAAFFSNFSQSDPLKATDAISASVTGRTVNRVRHLIPLRSLLILTTGGAWVFSGGDGVLTATSENSMEAQAEKRGTSAIPPVLIGNAGVYVLRDRKTVRDIGYAFADDAYVGTELSAPSEHLFETRQIVDMDYAETPDSVIWFVLDDGTAVTLTYMREHEVFGWTRHVTDGAFESVAVVEEDGYSAAYFLVRRTINGAVKRFIERLHERDRSSVAAGFYVDSGLTYSGAPATTISGLDHLIGEEVIALVDGDVVRTGSDGAPLVVDGSGEIELPFAGSLVHVGLEMTATARTLPLAPETERGRSDAQSRRASELVARIHKTPSLKARQYPNPDVPHQASVETESLKPYQPETWGGEAVATTGVVRIPLNGVWDDDCIVEFVSDDPVHFELQTIAVKAEVGS